MPTARMSDIVAPWIEEKVAAKATEHNVLWDYFLAPAGASGNRLLVMLWLPEGERTHEVWTWSDNVASLTAEEVEVVIDKAWALLMERLADPSLLPHLMPGVDGQPDQPRHAHPH